MLNVLSPEQRRALADFIRSRREKTSAASAGFPTGMRRRTPGLRREELGQLTGLSPTWITWIEQAREIAPSPTALARLAAALHLNHAERAYLFELAGRRDPSYDDAEVEYLDPAMQAAVDLIAAPAYILDRNWTARAWNKKASRLFGGWLDGAYERNLLRFIFTEPKARVLIADWEERARRITSEFRAATSPHVNDPSVRGLVEGLRRESADFARLWNTHGVLRREGGMRIFQHPRDGLLHYEQVTFNFASNQDFKLTILVQAIPGKDPTASSLRPLQDG